MTSQATDHLTEPKVLCPHCFHQFYSDEAFYITQHPQLTGDPVLTDTAAKRRYAAHEVQRNRDGQVLDPQGWPMIERACPVCHLQVPPELLCARPRFISVAGARGSGKTYFLTAMLHMLRKELPAHFNYTLDISDSHDVGSYVESVDQLFPFGDSQELVYLDKTTFEMLVNKVQFDEQEVHLPKPFAFHFRVVDPSKPMRRSSQERRSIVLYDNPGEAYAFPFDRDIGAQRHTQHLAVSDAVLFAFDPLLNQSIREKLRGICLDPQLTMLKPQRQENILTAVINRVRRYRGLVDGTRIDTPLAVCVQKFDVWSELLPHRHFVDEHSIVHFREHGIAGLDLQEINAISLLVRRLLEDLCPEFVAAAEANFSVVRYFPVAALNVSPQNDAEMLKVNPRLIQPFRVTHPLLWLFQRWGLLFHSKNRTDNPNRLPVALIRDVGQNRIRIQTPGGNLMTLDREYAGTSILDPQDGVAVWIPGLTAAEPVRPATENPSVVGQTKPGPDLTLKLDSPPPAPRKRGWFKGV